MNTKICSQCGIEKALTEFYPHKGCKLGVRPECIECKRKDARIYQQEHSEEKKAYLREYYQNNKEQHKKYQKTYKAKKNADRRERYKNDPEYREKLKTQAKEYHKKNPHLKKEQRLKEKYGMSLDEFDNMLKKANYSCEICGYSNLDQKSFFPLVDHCHDTGKVRGILCSKCNFALGNLNDDIKLFNKAIEYLQRTNSKPYVSSLDKNLKTQKMTLPKWLIDKSKKEII